MRAIDLVVVHCSATGPQMDIGVETIRRWHRERGYSDVGYHFVIRRNGVIEEGRPEEQAGAHAKGHNVRSIGVCLVGGTDRAGKPEANFTAHQYEALEKLLRACITAFPRARICGHRDLSPDVDNDGKVEPHEWLKDCPSFDVRQWCAQRGFPAGS